MNMLDQCRVWLGQMQLLVDECLNNTNSNLEQQRVLATIVNNIQLLSTRLPNLEQLHESTTHEQALKVMSHEWRTPITSILGFCTMIKQGVFGTPSEDILVSLVHLETIA